MTPGRTLEPRRALTFVVAGVVALGLVVGLRAFVPGASPPVAWSHLDTEDVHSLAFVADDPNRLVFGHHGGILSSTDGGRTWQSLATQSDAMSIRPGADGSIIIAGHDVFAISRDDGRTWSDVAADLPSIDIHGFARDPDDPAAMWVALATGGLWQSVDGGQRWERVQQQTVLSPVALAVQSGTRLLGLLAEGLATSDDGGRTWVRVTTPQLYPIASLAATRDGSVVVAGGPDGLARSDDGGITWSTVPFDGQPFALAVTAGGQTIALVTRAAEFFRSDDGGRSWPGP